MQPSTAPSAYTESSPGCASLLLFAGLAAWAIVVCVSVQAGGWFADQILLIEGLPVLGGWWLAIALGQAILLAPPVALLLYFTHSPRLRAA